MIPPLSSISFATRLLGPTSKHPLSSNGLSFIANVSSGGFEMNDCFVVVLASVGFIPEIIPFRNSINIPRFWLSSPVSHFWIASCISGIGHCFSWFVSHFLKKVISDSFNSPSDRNPFIKPISSSFWKRLVLKICISPAISCNALKFWFFLLKIEIFLIKVFVKLHFGQVSLYLLSQRKSSSNSAGLRTLSAWIPSMIPPIRRLF